MADPPWHYSNSGLEYSAEQKYPVMTPEQIMSLDVKSIAKPNSILLLWVTWPQVEVAMDIIKAWGFKYLTGFPWVKVKGVETKFNDDVEFTTQMGVGWWVRGVTEPIFICRRGRVSPPKTNFVGLLSPNLRHSRKPDSIYEYAETLEGPYLEMFARRSRPGWDVWGNEVESNLEIRYNAV